MMQRERPYREKYGPPWVREWERREQDEDGGAEGFRMVGPVCGNSTHRHAYTHTLYSHVHTYTCMNTCIHLPPYMYTHVHA